MLIFEQNLYYHLPRPQGFRRLMEYSGGKERGHEIAPLLNIQGKNTKPLQFLHNKYNNNNNNNNNTNEECLL